MVLFYERLTSVARVASRWATKNRLASHEAALLSLQGVALSGLKGFAAAATLTGLGIGNFESAAGQAVAEINNRAAQVLRAERIHQNRNPVHFRAQVVRPLLVEGHRVLHA